MEGGLGPSVGWVDGGGATDDVISDAVLGKKGALDAIELAGIGDVVAEQRFWTLLVASGAGRARCSGQQPVPDRGMVDGDGRGVVEVQRRSFHPGVPAPVVAEPYGGDDVDGGLVGAGVAYLQAPHQVLGTALRPGGGHYPVTVLGEDAGVHQLVLRLEPGAGSVGFEQVRVRERLLRVMVAPLQPGGGGSGVEVPPVVLHVLPVVALGAGEAVRPFLEDRVLAVPQRHRQAELLFLVADSAHPVLAPAEGPGTGVLERKIGPGVTVGGVVLPYRAPRPLGEVWAPPPPGQVATVGLGQPLLFIVHAAMLSGRLSRRRRRRPAHLRCRRCRPPPATRRVVGRRGRGRRPVAPPHRGTAGGTACTTAPAPRTPS